MKARTHHQAARRGRPAEWTCDDAEAARLQANETARPWGLKGPTPEEGWQRRAPLSPAERAAFAEPVGRERQQGGSAGGPADGAAVERVALSRALLAHGLLTFARQSSPAQLWSRGKAGRQSAGR